MKSPLNFEPTLSHRGTTVLPAFDVRLKRRVRFSAESADYTTISCGIRLYVDLYFLSNFFLPLQFFWRWRWTLSGGARQTIFVYFFRHDPKRKVFSSHPLPSPSRVFVHCAHTTGGDHTPRTRRRCTRVYSRIASWSQRPARAAPRSRSSFLGHVSLRSRSLCITRARTPLTAVFIIVVFVDWSIRHFSV